MCKCSLTKGKISLARDKVQAVLSQQHDGIKIEKNKTVPFFINATSNGVFATPNGLNKMQVMYVFHRRSFKIIYKTVHARDIHRIVLSHVDFVTV